MTLPTTGPISIGMVAAELGISLPLALGDSRVRTLAGKPTGPISLGDLRGKSAYTPPTIVYDPVADGSTFASVGEFADASATINFEIEGGEAPFTVTWTRISGSNQILVMDDNPPTFVSSGITNWASTATFRGDVTDNRGNSAPSAIVNVKLRAGDAI